MARKALIWLGYAILRWGYGDDRAEFAMRLMVKRAAVSAAMGGFIPKGTGYMEEGHK